MQPVDHQSRDHGQHQQGGKGEAEQETLKMAGEEAAFGGGNGYFSGHFISQIMDAFGQICFGRVVFHIEAYITRGKIHLYILHTFFRQVFIDVQCTGIAVHTFHLPLYLLHAVKLPNRENGLMRKAEYLGNMVANPDFCGMEMVFSLENMETAAAAFWQKAGTAKVFAFHGQMGAGKTTFIQALCRQKGVKQGMGSPTFSLINEYGGMEQGLPVTIYHIDLYRLNSPEDAVRAGVEDCLFSGHYCLVEWPERAPGLFPDDTVQVHIEPVDAQTRRLRIGNN